MEGRLCFKKKKDFLTRGEVFRGIIIVALMFMLVSPAIALEFQLAGKPLTVMGFINQSVQYSTAKNSFDTKRDF